MSDDLAVTQLQAAADPTRLMILRLVSGGAPTATDLHTRLEMSQPRVAHHVKILVQAGLIRARRDGRFMRYTLPPGGFAAKLVGLLLNDFGEPANTSEDIRRVPSGRTTPSAASTPAPRVAKSPPEDPGPPAGPDGKAADEDLPASRGIEDYLL